MIKGTLRADGLALMEIKGCSFLAGVENPRMVGRAAFISTATGATLGQVDHENWSKDTLEKLKALREAMENDLATVYFSGHQAPSSPTSQTITPNAPKGLADYLGKVSDAPQG